MFRLFKSSAHSARPFPDWQMGLCYLFCLFSLFLVVCFVLEITKNANKMSKSVPKTLKMRSRRVLFEAFLGLLSLLGTYRGPRWQKSALGSMIVTLKGRFWSHFRVQNGSKIDKKTIQNLIIFLIDFLIPKCVNLEAQNLPKWSPKWSKIDKMTDFYKK